MTFNGQIIDKLCDTEYTEIKYENVVTACGLARSCGISYGGHIMPFILKKRAPTEGEKNQYIQCMTRLLPELRIAAGNSQEELANIIGVSRQTLSSIESGKRKLPWPTFLALVLYFLSNPKTQEMLSDSGAYPEKVIGEMVGNFSPQHTIRVSMPDDISKMIAALDEQGIHTLKTTLMIEYARCTKQTGEAVLKSFDGMDYSFDLIGADQQQAMRALCNIQGKKHGYADKSKS